MARPRKLPANVIRLRPDEIRTVKRAEGFKARAKYLYRSTMPIGEFLIVEYSYNKYPAERWYAGGYIVKESGKFWFHHSKIREEFEAGNITLHSWRFESEWGAA